MAALEMFPNTVGESRILDIHFAKQLLCKYPKTVCYFKRFIHKLCLKQNVKNPSVTFFKTFKTFRESASVSIPGLITLNY